MIECKRYPHVRDIIAHYASQQKNERIVHFLTSGISDKEDAYFLSRFVLTVIDGIAKDMANNISVLGSVDNTSMIPDIDYEVSLYLADKGLGDIWDEVCDED